jgi:hypothetical protein
MKDIPKQSDGNIVRPVRVKGGFGLRRDVSGDGASPLPEKRIPLPKFTIPKKS